VNETTRKQLRTAKREYVEDQKANVCKWVFKKDYRGEDMITMEFQNVISKLGSSCGTLRETTLLPWPITSR